MTHSADVTHHISVLVVDDSAVFLQTLVTSLRAEAEVRVVGTAGDAVEALAKVVALQPQVILLDVTLPGMSGLEAIPHFRADIPGAGIVIITALDENSYRPAALAAGANDFVSKLKLKTDLLPAIRRAAQHR